jgi:hypothetical protein
MVGCNWGMGAVVRFGMNFFHQVQLYIVHHNINEGENKRDVRERTTLTGTTTSVEMVGNRPRASQIVLSLAGFVTCLQ